MLKKAVPQGKWVKLFIARKKMSALKNIYCITQVSCSSTSTYPSTSLSHGFRTAVGPTTGHAPQTEAKRMLVHYFLMTSALWNAAAGHVFMYVLLREWMWVLIIAGIIMNQRVCSHVLCAWVRVCDFVCSITHARPLGTLPQHKEALISPRQRGMRNCRLCWREQLH